MRGATIASVSAELRSLSDGELARRILGAEPGGARAEEDELCRRFGPRIRRYGLRHLRDPHAAEDLMQRVLATTVEGLRGRKLREPEAIASFVLGTCRALAVEDARGAKRRAELLEQYGADLRPADVREPLQDLDRLRDCVQKLPERARTLLVMTFFAGWESEEIARELGLSAANVRVVRRRALRQLLDCMEGSVE